jgi:hypothetical protein
MVQAGKVFSTPAGEELGGKGEQDVGPESEG